MFCWTEFSIPCDLACFSGFICQTQTVQTCSNFYVRARTCKKRITGKQPLSSSQSKRCERKLVGGLQQTCCNLRVSGCVMNYTKEQTMRQMCSIETASVSPFCWISFVYAAYWYYASSSRWRSVFCISGGQFFICV